ncbi:reverse transcriptase domain-containing protein [Tanacetum coccineum]
MKWEKRDRKNPGEKPLKSSLKKTNYTPSPKDGVDGVDRENGRNTDLWLVLYSPMMMLGLMGIREHMEMIGNMMSPSSKLSKKELSSIPVWIKFHGVPVSAFVADGLSVIATRLGTSVMLDSYIVTKCMQSWKHMDYVLALVDIRVDQDLKSIMVISVPNPIKNGVTMHTIKGGMSNDGFQTIQRKALYSLPNQQVPNFAYQKKTTSTLVSNTFFALEEDNGKPMDDLVDDTRKKVDA